jgi:putative transposase
MRELSLEGELAMPKGRRLAAEQIVSKLRQIEVLQGQGKNIAAACKEIGTTEQTFYRWRKEYGGLNVGQAKRLKQLEDENGRLKKLVADLSLRSRCCEISPRENCKPRATPAGS